MKRSTGIILRLLIVVGIMGLMAVVVYFVLKGTTLNEYEHTTLGKEALEKAEKLFEDAETATGEGRLADAEAAREMAWEELEKAKENFKQAIEVKSQWFPAHFGLGKSYLLEAENSMDDQGKAYEALNKAGRAFADTTRYYPLHMGAAIKRCEIFDKYFHDPEKMSNTAENALRVQEKKKKDDPAYALADAAEKRKLENRLRYYLAKGLMEVARRKSRMLVAGGGEDLSTQKKILSYAEVAVDFKRSAEVYRQLAGEEELPEELTLREAYLNPGKIYLQMIDVIWQVYQAKQYPPLQFDEMDPAQVPKAKSTLAKIGVLKDPEAPEYEGLSTVLEELGKSADEYFGKARQTSNKEDMEKTLLEEGTARCLYGITPPDARPPTLPGEQILDAAMKDESIAKTETFYTEYAELLMRLKKREKAGKVLKEGLEKLQSPAMHLELGKYYMRNGNLKDAENEITAALKAGGENEETHNELLSHLYLAMGALEKAREQSKWLLDRDPDNGDYLILRGRIELSDGKFEEARRQFERVYEKGPLWQWRGAYHLSALYHARRDWARAEEYLNKARQTGGPRPEVYSRLAVLLYNKGEIRKALEVCREYVTQSQNRNIPLQPQVLEIMAQCQEARDDKKGAQETYGKLATVGGNPYRMAMAGMLLRGITTIEEIDGAKTSFLQIIKSEEHLPPWEKTLGAYYGLARCEILRRKENRYAEAIKILEQQVLPIIQAINEEAEKREPEDPFVQEARDEYKTCLLQLYDYYKERTPTDREQLIHLVDKMREIAPEDPAVFLRYLRVQTMGLSRPEASQKEEELVMKALERPENTPEEQNRIKFLYAGILLNGGRQEDAREWYLKVQVPEDDREKLGLRVSAQLANICMNMEQFEEAEKYINVLREKYPRDRQTARVVAMYNAMREQNVGNRIAILKAEVEKHPDIVELRKSLGDAYMQAGGEGGADVVDRCRAALLEYGMVLERNRGRTDILSRLAVTHIALGGILKARNQMDKSREEYAEARKTLRKLLERNEDNPTYLRLLAETEVVDGRVKEALRLLEKASGIKEKQLKDARDNADPTVDRHKADLQLIYRQLIPLYEREERLDMAETVNEKLKGLATTAGEIVNQRVTAAIIAEKKGEYDRARQILEEAKNDEEIRKDSEQHMQLIRRIAMFYQRRKNAAATDEERQEYTEARDRVLDEGIELYPDAAQMYIWKAAIFSTDGEHKKALELVDMAVEKEDAREKDEDKDVRVYTSASWYHEQQARTRGQLEKAEKYLLEAIRLAPDEPTYKESLFRFYTRRKMLFGNKAREYVTELLKEDPENPRYLVFQGQLLVLADDPEGAREYYKKAVEMDPSLDSAYVQWSDTIFTESKDRIDEAMEVIEEGLKHNENSIALRNALARFCMIKKDYDGAREQFVNVLEINSRDFTALDGMARLALEELSNPAIDYRTALKNAINAVDTLFKFHPETPATHRVLGLLELQQGNPDKAVEHFKQAYALGHDPVSLKVLSSLCLRRQATSFKNRDILALTTWAGRLPGYEYNPALKLFVGRCIQKLGQEGAQTRFEDAARLSPEDPEPFLFSDICYLDDALIIAAEKKFNGCIERMDKTVDKVADFARIYFEAGYAERSIQLIERASKLMDEKYRPQLNAMLAYIYLFETTDEDYPDRIKKAEDLALSVIESDVEPKPSGALCVLGKIMCDRGGDEFQEGIKYLNAAIDADPMLPSYQCILAEVHYGTYMDGGKTADMKAALKAIENVIRLEPNYYMLPRLYLWRGDMHYKNRDTAKARQDYRKYLDLGGEERVEQIKKRLQE